MSAHPNSELSANQQSMLDLALGCDLKVSEPSRHAAIRARHHAIKTQQDAADYIHEVENKIHGRRKFKPTQSAILPTSIIKSLAKIKTTPGSGVQASIGILALMAFMVVAGWFAPAGLNLVLVMLSMLLIMIVLGISITNRPLGVLVNERNLMSLSRFQMAVWTVIILGAYFTFALVRIKGMVDGSLNGHPITDPLNIQIDWHLWALLGISTTSLVGAPLILSTKKDKEPAPLVTQKTAQMVDEPEQDIIANKQGVLYANSNISDARLTDMFQGDELTNTAQIDLAKVQMFYFTIIAVICFFVMVFKMLVTGNSDLAQLPLLPDGFVAILGISHAGYLTSKSISHTKSQP
jgi:hypothetical protein